MANHHRELLEENDKLKSEIVELKKDQVRLKFLYSDEMTDSNAIVNIELRRLSGEVVPIDEVREAIDTAIDSRSTVI